MNNRLGHLGFAANFPPSSAFQNWSKVHVGVDYCTDTTLQLDSPGTSGLYSSHSKGTKRKWDVINGTGGPAHSSSLALSLGRSPSSSDNSKVSSATACTMSSAKETDEESTMDLDLNFQLHLGSDNTPSPKKPAVGTPKAVGTEPMLDLQLSLSTGPSESVITSITSVPAKHQKCLETSVMIGSMPTRNGGSTPDHWKFGTSQLPLLYGSEATSSFPPNLLYGSEASSSFPPNMKIHANGDQTPAIVDLPSTMKPKMKSPVTCTSVFNHPQQRNINTKNCQYPGCVKGARGASGLCIAHGGGSRCQKNGCRKGAEGKTVYCKAHGGGRRCEHLGCTKSAEGRTDYCIAHGGGRRCSHQGCGRAARGKSGLCIRHGGGKRCQMENCTKSAEGYSGLCISHGGGRRCQFPECTKGAQGSTMFCKAHGGGKRCTALGCSKGAEGSTPFCKGHGGGKRCSFQDDGRACPKSVHGGTQFCVAHGGGKRCAVVDCTKSARGRTDFCVRHGGGKRCKSEACGKSAQGSTDFCKAHGGGKRCSWGQVGSDLGIGNPPCDRFARGKTGLCAAHSALVQDHRVHGGGTLRPPIAQQTAPSKPEKLEGVAVEEYLFSKNGEESFLGWNSFIPTNFAHPVIHSQPRLVSLPERRVHGGSLLAMLTRGEASGSHSGSRAEDVTSDKGVPYAVPNN